jgi:hypothetical protein
MNVSKMVICPMDYALIHSNALVHHGQDLTGVIHRKSRFYLH